MLDRINVKYFKLAVGNENIGKETGVDIAARCPICGDSKTHKNKKRLHLYEKGGLQLVHCFNGDCALNGNNKTIKSFLYEFYPSLLDQYKRENFRNTMQSMSSDKGDVFKSFKTEPLSEGSLEDMLNDTEIAEFEEEVSPVLIHDLTPYLKLITEKPEALKYLTNRGIEYSYDFGEWYFGYQDLKIGTKTYKITDSIVIPLYYKDEMYGFYSRNIFDKTFSTYMHDSNVGYKIFNWFNVDKDEKVYIFEGIFDSLSIGSKNIIALMGAKIPNERLDELKKPVFVLDNDRTGILNSIEYARKGHYVYIQPSEYTEKDMNELMLNHPDLDVLKLINDNLYTGISAEVRLKMRL